MTFDVTAIITAITAAGVAAGTIGAAYLVFVLGVKIWKALRSAA